MKLSIIIPTYKPQEWFDECLLSIYNQTLDHSIFEVLIILNGDLSFDAYVIDLISKYDDKINFQYFTSEVGSVSNARNIGLDNANGEYICFIDSDDYVSPNYLEGLLKKSTINNVSVSNVECFTNRVCDSIKSESFTRSELTLQDNPLSKNINHFYFSTSVQMCFHRNIIAKNRFPTRFQLGEDSLFMLSLSYRINKLLLADESCIYYIRETPNSLSRSTYDKFFLIKLYLNRCNYILKLYFKNIQSNDVLLFLRKLIGTFIRILKLVAS